MSFFDEEDPFENIVREFFGDSRLQPSEKMIQTEREERIIDFVETENKIFVIFELPGYFKEDINLIVAKRNIEIKIKKKNIEKIQGYLSQKLLQGRSIKKSLPDFIKTKNFSHTFKNGVLEVVFDKKWLKKREE